MTPILHHYPPSLFSEKIRVLFGYLGLAWQSTIIPPIMPRPHLMPLSGGYRKTPILQIGANVYCDTEIICRKLADLAGDKTLYAHGFAGNRAARWADTELFRTVVALNFREQAVAAQMSAMSAAEMEAFQKDRAELSGGAPIVASDPAAAEAYFLALLADLESSVADGFLLGSDPSIADFSLYHCLWFVAGNAANVSLFDGFDAVKGYMARMAAFGHGDVEELPAEDALAIGTAAEPVMPDGGAQGDPVAVAANDYGRNPIEGRLILRTAHEIVIEREDAQAGRIMVHFPTTGFDITAR